MEQPQPSLTKARKYNRRRVSNKLTYARSPETFLLPRCTQYTRPDEKSFLVLQCEMIVDPARSPLEGGGSNSPLGDTSQYMSHKPPHSTSTVPKFIPYYITPLHFTPHVQATNQITLNSKWSNQSDWFFWFASIAYTHRHWCSIFGNRKCQYIPPKNLMTTGLSGNLEGVVMFKLVSPRKKIGVNTPSYKSEKSIVERLLKLIRTAACNNTCAL